MITNSKLSAYIFRGSTAALLFSCVIVALCSAINLPEQPPKVPLPQDNAAFGANGHASAASVPASATRSLSFAERVAYQRAIEDVYWRHRIWPKTNPGPKPPLDKVLSQAQLEKKVTEYLRNSQALEDYWQRPITAEQLQAEMERIAQHTKQPEVLRELFEALGNDPFVIAECLARPLLAERLAAGTTVVAEPALSASRTGVSPASTKLFAADTAASTENRFRATNRGVTSYQLPVIASPSGGCTNDTWTPTTLTNAPSARDHHTAVWTGSEMILWGGWDGGPSYFNTGWRYDPATDSWTATSTTNAPSARQDHTAVWTGTEMIVWGGGDNTGGRYNPITDNWTATSLINVPPGLRGFHTAVWTGSEMIVWGGAVANALDTGGRYDPGTDSWTATSTINAPEARYWHTAVWTGREMIVWGGWNENFWINTGGRYDPGTDSWTATTTTNAPIPRGYAYCQAYGAVWTGSEMIVWGGAAGGVGYNTGGRYHPSTDSWTATSLTNAPVGRNQHATVWTGSEMIVWGGFDFVSMLLNSGGRYDPGTDSWRATSITNAPDARRLHQAVWTGSEMIIWGGRGVGTCCTRINTGGRYCAPSPTPTPRPQPTPRPRPTPAPRP